MVASIFLGAFMGLLHPAVSHSLSSRTLAEDGISVPRLKTDFKKGDTPAKWAEGYPKKWGSEDYRFQFNIPDPSDTFNAMLTEDEKYLAMFNGSHATFVDVNSKATISTFGLSSGFVEVGLAIRSIPQGGYEIFTGGGSTIHQRRVSSDLKLTGDPVSYPGDMKALQGKRLVTSSKAKFTIYDLSSPNRTSVELKNPPAISDMSFSSDGRYLSSVSWLDMVADLWNTTTGEKIIQFPKANAQNRITRISPDDKHVFNTLGTGFVRVYSLANLTAEPKVLGAFRSWIGTCEWSPDGKYLAAGDSGRMQVWKFPEAQLVQTWDIDFSNSANSSYVRDALHLTWLDNGSKVSWTYRYGRYMYDFESNLKYWWTPGYDDHAWRDGGVSFLKKTGHVATTDGDSRVRLWKI